ncbi:PhnD/SsuA/transferrin family substrate-binding protein [Calothrix membranacea FACHB-236]|nr:PhnD/SsuA/transferrin family substrate-binding protein [Calothrix membranacea FACHB-236]
MKKLQAISYLAPNWFGFYEAVLAYLDRVLGAETQLKQGECDPLLDPLILKDQLDLAFICGLPLIRYSQIVLDQLQPVVAPVMQALRYRNRPIYFSDVIVNADSDVIKFDDLAGKTVCYNDPGSNSGYNLLRHRLLQGRYPQQFFSQAIQSGSHQNSIRWVALGKVDCAAIDSVVLEQELQDFPELYQYLRVVEALGPCPMPPLVAAQHLGKSLIEQIQLALLEPDAELQTAMQLVGVKHFAVVELADYNAIADIYNADLKAGYESL